MVMPTAIACAECGEQFLGRNKLARFCRTACRRRFEHRKRYAPRVGPCQVCGKPHRKGQMRCELRVTKSCPQCGEDFLAYKQAIFCNPRCANKFDGRENKRSRRYYYNHTAKYREFLRDPHCANCGKSFDHRGSGFFLHCSDTCAHETRKARWARDYWKDPDKSRKKSRDQMAKRSAAFKIFRELFDPTASWRDHNEIYQALKAELGI